MTVSEISSFLSIAIALIAAFVTFQNFRLTGVRRVAEFKKDWLNKIRTLVSELMAELSQWDERKLNSERVHLLMESIDLHLDMTKPSHAALKNELIPLAMAAQEGNYEGVRVGFHNVGNAARALIREEDQYIEASLRRWV
jgi:hypothetical protein